MELSSNCTIFIAGKKGDAPSPADIQKKLESNQDDVKAQGLEELIYGMVQGERYERLLMAVIRFCVPCSNNRVKKLTFLFLEIVDKCDAQGKLKEEVILVCNALRNDLTSPNEYVRGSALRLAAKIRQAKIIEPLVEAILKNLTHRHSYVRRNAVLCVFCLVRHFGPDFIPSAAEQIDQLLLMEGDASTRRAAFLMLLHCDTKRALLYIQQQQQQQEGASSLLAMGDQMQLAVLELLRKVSTLKLPAKAALLRLAISLLSAASPAVAYEAACCVVKLQSKAVGLRTACGALCHLLLQQTEYNVKLIVLDRIAECVAKAKPKTLSEFVVDLMRGLQTNSLDVRRRILELVRRLVAEETAPQVVAILKKQIAKSGERNADTTPGCAEYRALLVEALASSCCLYPSVVSSCLSLICDLLGDADPSVATKAALLLRLLAAKHCSLRRQIVQQIVECVQDPRHSRVLRICCWLVGEFCDSAESLETFVDALYAALSPLPLTSVSTPQGGGGDTRPQPEAPHVQTRTVVLADGSYGTEDVVEGDSAEPERVSGFVREAILEGDTLLACVVAVSLTKLLLLSSPDYLLRRKQQAAAAAAAADEEEGEAWTLHEPLKVAPRQQNKCLLIVSSLLKFVRASVGETSDAAIRINQALKACLLLTGGSREKLQRCFSWFDGGRQQLLAALSPAHACDEEFLLLTQQPEEVQRVAPADSQILFRLLLPVQPGETAEETRIWDEDALFEETDDEDDWQQQQRQEGHMHDLQPDVAVAVGERQPLSEAALFQQRLRGVQQMTGLADAVYVEAFVRVNQFDMLLELLVVNRTPETLFNVAVELATHGEVRLVDRPSPLTLSPFGSATCRASLKIKTTEAAVLFGVVSFERKAAARVAGREYVLLAELPLDVLAFIKPTWISDSDFRNKWQEFEWENKLQIASPATSVGSFLENLVRHTKMTVVGSRPPQPHCHQKKAAAAAAAAARAAAAGYTVEELEAMMQSLQQMPELQKLAKECSLFSINLYSRSVFGEDALANVSLEKLPCGKLSGSVRIRSRTQGIALSVGDRITSLQRRAAAEC